MKGKDKTHVYTCDITECNEKKNSSARWLQIAVTVLMTFYNYVQLFSAYSG